MPEMAKIDPRALKRCDELLRCGLVFWCMLFDLQLKGAAPRKARMKLKEFSALIDGMKAELGEGFDTTFPGFSRDFAHIMQTNGEKNE